MKKQAIFGFGGFAVGVLLFAVAREIWLSFSERPAGVLLGAAFHWIGTFRWLYDYQTLIAAMIALVGAGWAAGAVYTQIKQAEQIESARRADRAAAARAVLPLALSEISDYAESCARQLKSLIEATIDDALPESVDVGVAPDLPAGAIEALRNLVEVMEGDNRRAISILIGTIQIQRSRLKSLRNYEEGDGHIILRLNLERYVVDAAEVYAQAAALYDFGRKPASTTVSPVKRSNIASALHNMRVFDDLYDVLVARYGLASEEIWVPPFAESDQVST